MELLPKTQILKFTKKIEHKLLLKARQPMFMTFKSLLIYLCQLFKSFYNKVIAKIF